MADGLSASPVQVELKRGRHWYELTLTTRDRPFLFATLAGVLAAWGMNIVKANAFSNEAGIVVDTFHFTDRFRTLELNLSEWERFKNSVTSVLLGEADLEKMLRDRQRSEKGAIAKVKVETKIEFDDSSSATSTLVQVITQDRPRHLCRKKAATRSSKASGQGVAGRATRGITTACPFHPLDSSLVDFYFAENLNTVFSWNF